MPTTKGDLGSAIGRNLHHAAVAGIGDEDVARSIDRQTVRLSQPVAQCDLGSAMGRNLHHPVVIGIRDEYITICIHCHAGGNEFWGRCTYRGYAKCRLKTGAEANSWSACQAVKERAAEYGLRFTRAINQLYFAQAQARRLWRKVDRHRAGTAGA